MAQRIRVQIYVWVPDASLRSTCSRSEKFPGMYPLGRLFVCLFVLARQPSVGHGLLIHEVSRPHTTTHHSRCDSSGRVISASRRPLPDNTQNSQQTNVHSPRGIRNHNSSRRAAADRLRPRGHWGRHQDVKR